MSADAAQDIGFATHAPRARGAELEGFKLHRVGVEIEAWVDEAAWHAFGELLQRINQAWEWVVADWLAFGDHRYGDGVYDTAARLFGKSPRTWEDYAYIARNVRASERSEILPVLAHKPVARFSNDPQLQATLLEIAAEHGLSKRVFESVIELYLQGESYAHLLPAELTPLGRARLRAEKERERVRKRALSDADGAGWVEHAREQAERWQRLAEELGAAPGTRT